MFETSEPEVKTAILLLHTEGGGVSYRTSTIFGPDDSICA
jgi:hypothetical protein